MNKPLLTIAIPTWNRGNILDYALSELLPQISKYKNNVEVVVSDNGSVDNTMEVITNHIKKNQTLNIVHNTQPENTGFYGNFHKCRTLSKGSYFWLLSDNDFVANGLVDYIMKILLEKDPSFIFLRDWKHASKVNKKSQFTYKEYSALKGIETFNYKTTLISAVIFENNKSNDIELFNNFKGNTFLGFAFFLQSLISKKNAIQIEGVSLFISKTKVNFNAFKSFAVDLIKCFNYAESKNILPQKTIDIFLNNVIYGLTVKHYIAFRITGRLHNKKYGKDFVDSLLKEGFSNYSYYGKYLEPLQVSSKFKFYKIILKKHSMRLFKERLLRYL